MSDYPRPVLQSSPVPYRLDRPVASVMAVLACVSTVKSVLYTLHQPHPASDNVSWAKWFVIYAATLAIYLWVLWGMARSRFWSFMTLLILTGFATVGSAIRGIHVMEAIYFMIAAFSLARLCTLLGPRPIRRHELRV